MEEDQQWSDRTILRAIDNPCPELNYETVIKDPEITFNGVKGQPDFGVVTIKYVPEASVIELKALKSYFHDFRDKVISYERFISVVFEDLMATYEPRSLIITAVFNPRGGMTSTLVVDSSAQSKT